MGFSTPQGDSLRSKGEDVQLQAPLDKINLHLREGSVIPTQVKRIFDSNYIILFWFFSRLIPNFLTLQALVQCTISHLFFSLHVYLYRPPT